MIQLQATCPKCGEQVAIPLTRDAVKGQIDTRCQSCETELHITIIQSDERGTLPTINVIVT